MGGALTALGVYTGTIASGSSYDIRPPAGEVWIVTSYNWSANHNLYFVNGSGVSGLGIGSSINGRWKPVLHNSKMWLRFSANTGNSASGSFFGFRASEGDPYVPAYGKLDVPASGTVEARPAAGKVWVITDLMLVDAGVTFYITDGTNNISTGLANTSTPHTQRKVVLTNSVWFKAVNGAGFAQQGFLNGWEQPDTRVRPLSTISVIANGVTEEFAPPADETWVFTHYSAPTLTFTIEGTASLSHGNVAITSSTENSPARNIAVSGSGSWARRTGDGSAQYYLGFKI